MTLGPVLIPLITITCTNPARLSVIMNANIAGIYGAQIFRADDKPLYRRGFSIAIAVLSLGLALAIARWLENLLRRRRNGDTVSSEGGSKEGVSTIN